MADPNDEFVVDPVPEQEETQEEVVAPAQSIRVEETEEYKRLAAEKAEIERRARDYEERLRQAQQPAPEKKEPTEDPLDALEDQLADASGKFNALETWCLTHPKDPDIAMARSERDIAKKQMLAIQKAYRLEATKAHVAAVKGLASKQSEYQRASDHWAREIENDPLCQELTEEAKVDLHAKIMNGADPVKARAFVRKMLRLDPDKVSTGVRPSLQSLPGGRSTYIQTEGAGGGTSTSSDDDDFEKQLAARRARQAKSFG